MYQQLLFNLSLRLVGKCSGSGVSYYFLSYHYVFNIV